ncbi:MAG: class I SAM-dependent methyltransferase [Cyanobacteria bacterium P01_D01_bin.128]
MTREPSTLFERFLAPVLGQLIDQGSLKRYAVSIDWEVERDRLTNPSVAYPDYYLGQNFHGIEGGYLTTSAAITYDPITQYVLPPTEQWVRQSLIDAVAVTPRRILDLGCGTGTSTRMLKQAFPDAEVIGLDLSPYMLVMAKEKAQRSRLEIQWHHGLAEATHLPSQSVDLITLNLLFHEVPSAIAEKILQECFRLLTSGGEVLILDGKPEALQQLPWLMDIFEEPYIQDYARAEISSWMTTAGFGAVSTQTVWWIHQLTRGVKPLAGQKPVWSTAADLGYSGAVAG